MESGRYLSQDPIGLAGGMALYGYVSDVNMMIDALGLSSNPATNITFTDTKGTTLTTNGYTDISHLTESELKSMHYMNTVGNGMAPKDVKGNPIVLHHYKQNTAGPIVAMPGKYHDKPFTNAATSNGRSGQHPFGKTKGGGLTVDERIAFNKWKKEFYTHLAETEMKKKGISFKSYK